MTQNQAFDILKLGENAYITGPAGSGKTYLLGRYIKYLKDNSIEVGVTASTGIAATHIGGVTIHSWSGLGIKESISGGELKKLLRKSYLKKRFESAKVLIIDEISMINAFQFDLIDKIAKAFKMCDKPFGGLQVVCSGDFFQLPPIQRNGEARFVVDSDIWKEMDMKICYLGEQHRQNNDGLLKLLNHIRENNVAEAKNIINSLQFNENEFPAIYSKLYTHNIDVDAINSEELEKINNKEEWYRMYFKGSRNIADTLKKGCLAPERLAVKKGAKVMFVKNNFEAGYINGTLGEVEGFSEDNLPIIKTTEGRKIEAKHATWIVEEEGKIKAEIRQIPIRLAWAITIHKSQGMNIDAAEIDLSKSFTPGMGYVALSRLKTLKGLKLTGINDMAFQVNKSVLEEDKKMKAMSDETVNELKSIPEPEKIERQKNFLTLIMGRAKNRSKASTHEITKDFVKDKLSVVEMAHRRNLSIETIISHLEKIAFSNEEIDLEYLRPKAERFKKIKEAFEKSGDFKLHPVKDILGDGFSYLEIKLARLFLANKAEIN